MVWLPKETAQDTSINDDNLLVDDSVITLLKVMKYGSGETKAQYKKKVNVLPGKNVSGIDFETNNEDQ